MNEHFYASIALPLTYKHASSFRPATARLANVSRADADNFCSRQVPEYYMLTGLPISEIGVVSVKLYSELDVSYPGCSIELQCRQGIGARTHINSAESRLSYAKRQL